MDGTGKINATGIHFSSRDLFGAIRFSDDRKESCRDGNGLTHACGPARALSVSDTVGFGCTTSSPVDLLQDRFDVEERDGIARLMES